MCVSNLKPPNRNTQFLGEAPSLQDIVLYVELKMYCSFSLGTRVECVFRLGPLKSQSPIRVKDSFT